MSRVTRIGFLVDGLLSRYQLRLFNAVRRPARRRGAVVLGFPGSYLLGSDPARPVFDGSFIFDLIGPACVDGLVVASNVLLSGAGEARIQAICEKSGVPAVSIGPLASVPSVDIDNTFGLKRVIEHLIEVHDRRRLAFIRGPITNPDSLERENVFRSTLSNYRIEVDPDHSVTGNFLEGSGAAAVRTLFDERKLGGKIDGIVIANDQMAAGAIRELRARGIRVPEEIAVVGFDDDEHARSTNPPLTTVAQPLCKMGEVAVSLLFDRLEGREVKPVTLLETVPIWRRSCGCQSSAGVYDVTLSLPQSSSMTAADRCDLFADQFTSSVGFRHIRQGIDAALEVLSANNPDELIEHQRRFERIVWDAAEQGIDPLQWEDILSPLHVSSERQHAFAPGEQMDVSIRSQSIHWLLAELSARARLEDQLRTLELANSLRVVGSAVVCARNVRALARVLEAGLPGLDVRFCYVCVFTDKNRDRAEVVAVYDPAEPRPHDQIHSPEQLWRAIPPTVPPGHFASRQALSSFPTSGILPPLGLLSNRGDMLVYPLVMAEDSIGYVVVDAPDDVQRAWLLEGLSGHLSSAVYEIHRTEQLRAAQVLAEEASSAKSAFVAMMSHEVRTPLNAVIGNVDLCLKTDLTREQRRYLERAQSSSRSLLGIVDDILDFSKIEARRIEIEQVSFDVEDLIEQVVINCSPDACRKDLELIVETDEGVPYELIGDSLRLMQVLVNLVNNAVKFSTKGHVRLRITCHEDRIIQGLFLKFAVEDTGIGMQQNQIERIFKPFTQADNSITRRYGGTGLGLTICQRLVELMGGTLSVRSEPGRGSTFEFALPFPPAKASGPFQVPTYGRVFVVESYAPQNECITSLICQFGLTPTSVASGQSFFSALAEFLRDPSQARFLVFVSSQLNDMDGITLAQRLATVDPEHRAVVVLLTPYNNSDFLTSDMNECNISAVLAKPVQRSQLRRVLEQRGESGAPTAEPTEPHQPLNHRRILVVQDSDMSRELARDLLTLSGAVVLVASDGEEAVALAERERLDLVLMDINLPKMDGISATRRIRQLEHAARLPILALSASSSPLDHARCIESGMNDFIRAPVNATTLVSTVQRWCQGGVLGGFSDIGRAPSSSALRITSSQLPTLEAARALARLGNNSALYRKLLTRFVESYESMRLLLQESLDGRDPARATSAVHNLVSAAGNIGATRLQQVAQTFEAALRGQAESLYLEQRGHFESEFRDAFEAARLVIAKPIPTSGPPLAPAYVDVEQRLAKLKRLITDHDTAAVEVVDELGDVFTKDLMSSSMLRKLAQSVMAYDFESASLQLDKLTESLVRETSGGLS